MSRVSQELGITENMIHPVINYTTDVECQLHTDILILRALRQILRLSTDFLTDKIERKNI